MLFTLEKVVDLLGSIRLQPVQCSEATQQHTPHLFGRVRKRLREVDLAACEELETAAVDAYIMLDENCIAKENKKRSILYALE